MSYENQVRNARGQWVPSIPLPFYGLRKRCECGLKFWTMNGYRGHYALSHILFPPWRPEAGTTQAGTAVPG